MYLSAAPSTGGRDQKSQDLMDLGSTTQPAKANLQNEAAAVSWDARKVSTRVENSENDLILQKIIQALEKTSGKVFLAL